MIDEFNELCDVGAETNGSNSGLETTEQKTNEACTTWHKYTETLFYRGSLIL